MRRIAVALVLCMAAGNASALSCLLPNIATSYKRYDAAPERYILVLGTLTAVGGERPVRKMHEITPQPRRYDVQFNGFKASRGGFDQPFTARVEVVEACLASWCGTAPIGREALVFLEVTPAGLRLTEGPCGGAIFADPRKKDIRRARNCLRGGACSSRGLEN